MEKSKNKKYCKQCNTVITRGLDLILVDELLCGGCAYTKYYKEYKHQEMKCSLGHSLIHFGKKFGGSNTISCNLCITAVSVARQWGISFEQAIKLKSGPCEVCGDICRGVSICIDHDHKTGKLRGALCNRCNTALGMLRDNPVIIESLLEYAKLHTDA